MMGRTLSQAIAVRSVAVYREHLDTGSARCLRTTAPQPLWSLFLRRTPGSAGVRRHCKLRAKLQTSMFFLRCYSNRFPTLDRFLIHNAIPVRYFCVLEFLGRPWVIEPDMRRRSLCLFFRQLLWLVILILFSQRASSPPTSSSSSPPPGAPL